MIYHLILILIIKLFITPLFGYSLDNPKESKKINKIILTKDIIIKTHSKNPISPINKDGNKIILIVDEPVLNKYYSRILLPKGAEIICEQESSKFTSEGFIVSGVCNIITLYNGKQANFKSIIYDKDGNPSIKVDNSNKLVLSGTQLILIPEEDINLKSYFD